MSGGRLTLTPIFDARAVERALVELRTLESELRVMVSQPAIHAHLGRLMALTDAMAEETARAMVSEGSA